ncbi:S9 family peptidase [Salinirubellus salinus]|uniref:S9 family peptidase n=1 Tax=Salinirubellus salinus TaxID=1364945 RepID=A0A9E7U9J7_9EURY|nr:S9 family peptidase [Salinirubellus salinus]UWM53102.1 S9 family peptidase [Salinirubellus salinus]
MPDSAADATTVAAKDFRDVVQVSDPRLSPDGSEVAFVRTVPEDDESYTATVYVVPTDGEGGPRRFTATEGTDAHPRYSPGGELLAFTSARGEAEIPQLWLVPTDGGEAEQVTNVPGGVDAFEWSPDGERILFTQSVTADEREAGADLHTDEEYEREDPDPRVVDRLVYRQFQQYADGRRSHVYLYDVEFGEGTDHAGDAVERITEGDADFVSPTWGAPDTVYYAVQRVPEPDDSRRFEVDSFDVETYARETLFEVTDYLPTLAATADGRVAFTRREEDRASMRQADVGCYADGETRLLTEQFDRTVAALVPPGLTWVDDDSAVRFVASNEGSVGVWAASTDGEVAPVVDHGTTSSFHATDHGTAFARSEPDHPGDVFFLPAGADEPRRLTEVNADYLAERDIGQLDEVRFESGAAHDAQRTTTDGDPVDDEVQGWVVTPPGYDPDGDREYPLLVQVHGGPHVMYTPSIAFHEFRTLAAAGYVVFWCNPRGSTGYGEAFAEAIERDWGKVTMADVEAGVEHVTEAYAVDPDEQFLTGGSFGGFITGWLVGHTDRYRAAVAQRGVYDLSSFYGSTDAFSLVEGDFDTTPWESPAFLWEQSPVAHVADIDTPTLVMHAEEDYRVPVNNGEMFYLFLRKQGVDTRLVRYPREGHELSRSGEPAHVVDRIERIRRWMDGYSEYTDVPRALDRGDDEGLEVGGEGDDEADQSGDVAEDGRA